MPVCPTLPASFSCPWGSLELVFFTVGLAGMLLEILGVEEDAVSHRDRFLKGFKAGAPHAGKPQLLFADFLLREHRLGRIECVGKSLGRRAAGQILDVAP